MGKTVYGEKRQAEVESKKRRNGKKIVKRAPVRKILKDKRVVPE